MPTARLFPVIHSLTDVAVIVEPVVHVFLCGGRERFRERVRSQIRMLWHKASHTFLNAYPLTPSRELGAMNSMPAALRAVRMAATVARVR